MSNWESEQVYEKDWWSLCTNTYMEEEKQLIYAKKMGLKMYYDGKTPYNFDVKGKILDIGGGPISMLLKCSHAKGKVVDPCEYPQWVIERYKCAGIEYNRIKGEDINELGYAESWIYNCLQHTEDPAKICANALKASKLVRVFEWVDNGVSPGHPQNLHEAELNQWLGGIGKVEMLNTPVCKGKCYFGIFMGKQ